MFHHCQWSTGWSFKARCGAIAAGYTQPGSRVVSLEKRIPAQEQSTSTTRPCSPETLTIDLAKVVSARLYMYILYAVYKYIDTFIHIILYHIYIYYMYDYVWTMDIYGTNISKDCIFAGKNIILQGHHPRKHLLCLESQWWGHWLIRWPNMAVKCLGYERIFTCRTFVLDDEGLHLLFFSNVIWCPTHQVYFNLGFSKRSIKFAPCGDFPTPERNNTFSQQFQSYQVQAACKTWGHPPAMQMTCSGSGISNIWPI